MWQINQNMWKKEGEKRIDLIAKYKWENKIKESTGERKKTENVDNIESKYMNIMEI